MGLAEAVGYGHSYWQSGALCTPGLAVLRATCMGFRYVKPYSSLANILDMWVDAFDHFQPERDPAEALTAYVRDKMRWSRTRPLASGPARSMPIS